MYSRYKKPHLYASKKATITHVESLRKKDVDSVKPVEHDKEIEALHAEISKLHTQLKDVNHSYTEIVQLLRNHNIDFSGELGFSAKYAIERLLAVYHAHNLEDRTSRTTVHKQEPVAEVIQHNHGRYITLILTGAEPLEIGQKLYKDPMNS